MKFTRVLLWPILLNALVFAVLAQPSNVSVSPSSGAGLTQTFAFTASSPAGYASMQWFQIIFNTSTSGVGACYMYVSTTSSTVYLMNDTQTNWVGTATSVAAQRCRTASARSIWLDHGLPDRSTI